MIIHEPIHHQVEWIKQNASPPHRSAFLEGWLKHAHVELEQLHHDFSGFRGHTLIDAALDMDWKSYHQRLHALDVAQRCKAVREELNAVESLTERTLTGKALVFAAFGVMDGYARFEWGDHCVYLGLDEDFRNESAMRVLISHELTHVARESRPETWSNWGLPFKMDHDTMVERLPTLEHLFQEGVSCLVSELLHPDQHPSAYTYQSEEDYHRVIHGLRSEFNQTINRALDHEHYRVLYDPEFYPGNFPRYAQYIWAHAWVRQLHQNGMSVPDLICADAKSLIDRARSFAI